jgi:carboxylate-amine ligase
VEVSAGERYAAVHRTMRELARREPTFALHVHVGVADPERATRLMRALRGHLPLLLALSGNSPFWQGRDSGMASIRTSLFRMFPRVGVPRAFPTYGEYVEAVDRLVRCGAIPEPTFLWWDLRLQPSLGTVEVRVMDAQSEVWRSAALAALVRSIAHLELEAGDVEVPDPPAEILDENLFLAARDGAAVELLDPVAERAVPLRDVLESLLDRLAPHARRLGCAAELGSVRELAADGGADRQRRVVREQGEAALLPALAASFD